jgi:ankyrin repeat protein
MITLQFYDKTIVIDKELYNKINKNEKDNEKDEESKNTDNEEIIKLPFLPTGFYDIVWYYTNGGSKCFPNNIDVVSVFHMLKYFNNTDILIKSNAKLDRLFGMGVVNKNDYIISLLTSENINNLCFDKTRIEQFLNNPCEHKQMLDHNNHKCTLLFMLVGFDRLIECENLLKMLLNHPKLDVNFCDGNGVTALMLAFNKKTNARLESMIKILLDHPKINVNLQNNEGQTALIIASSKKSNVNSVKMLLDHPKIDVNLRTTSGWTALMKASKYNENTVKLLLDHPEIDVNLQNPNGWTALTLASRFSGTDSSENTVKMLLAHPKINVNHQPKDGWTALIVACHYSTSTENTVKILLDHPEINVNLQTERGSTALMFASLHNAIQLLNHPKINVNIQKNDGSTALMLYVNADRPETVKILLGHPEIKVNVVNNNGSTALMIVSKNSKVNSSNIVKMLLEHPQTFGKYYKKVWKWYRTKFKEQQHPFSKNVSTKKTGDKYRELN